MQFLSSIVKFNAKFYTLRSFHQFKMGPHPVPLVQDWTTIRLLTTVRTRWKEQAVVCLRCGSALKVAGMIEARLR